MFTYNFWRKIISRLSRSSYLRFLLHFQLDLSFHNNLWFSSRLPIFLFLHFMQLSCKIFIEMYSFDLRSQRLVENHLSRSPPCRILRTRFYQRYQSGIDSRMPEGFKIKIFILKENDFGKVYVPGLDCAIGIGDFGPIYLWYIKHCMFHERLVYKNK